MHHSYGLPFFSQKTCGKKPLLFTSGIIEVDFSLVAASYISVLCWWSINSSILIFLCWLDPQLIIPQIPAFGCWNPQNLKPTFWFVDLWIIILLGIIHILIDNQIGIIIYWWSSCFSTHDSPNLILIWLTRAHRRRPWRPSTRSAAKTRASWRRGRGCRSWKGGDFGSSTVDGVCKAKWLVYEGKSHENMIVRCQ